MRHLARVNLFNLGNKTLLKRNVRNSSKYYQILDDLITVNNRGKRFQRVYQTEYHTLKDVYAESGAISELPKWYKFGMAKIIATIVGFIMIGSMMSKISVKILEENDIFKPEDDDDDEDD